MGRGRRRHRRERRRDRGPARRPGEARDAARQRRHRRTPSSRTSKGRASTARSCRRFEGRRSPTSAILVDRKRRAARGLLFRSRDPRRPVVAPGRTAGRRQGGSRRHPLGRRGGAPFRLARRSRVPAVLDATGSPRSPDVMSACDARRLQRAGSRGDDRDRRSRGRVGRAGGASTANWLAVTVGEAGVYFIENGRVAARAGISRRAVDTLGAGDVWHGAFALGARRRHGASAPRCGSRPRSRRSSAAASAAGRNPEPGRGRGFPAGTRTAR